VKYQFDKGTNFTTWLNQALQVEKKYLTYAVIATIKGVMG